MTDLIEELRLAREVLIPFPALAPTLIAIDKAIAALSPVLPDDVAKEVRYLRLEHCNRAADMMERLAGEVFDAELAEDREFDRANIAEQRIAELEANSIHSCSPFCTRPLCVAQRRIAELENRNTALLMLIDEDKRTDQSDDRI